MRQKRMLRMRDVSTRLLESLRVRLLENSDLARLEALEQRQWRPWSRRQLEEVLQDDATGVLGVELADELLAYAVVARLPFDAELQAMLVAPEWRRHGLGASLLQAVIDQAREWRSEHLLLEVRAGNAAALQLYRRAGFIEAGRRRGYYPPLEESTDASREDAVLMSRRL